MRYSAIKPVDIANGPGVRVSLFVSGCPHHCKGCFNAETWSFNHGEEFTDITTAQLVELLAPNYIRGMSWLGGEPLAPQNIDVVTRLAKTVRETYPQKDIWCYTGYLWDDVRHLPIMQYVDVLVDGPFIEAEKDLMLLFRGSRNQRLIDVPKSISGTHIDLWKPTK